MFHLKFVIQQSNTLYWCVRARNIGYFFISIIIMLLEPREKFLESGHILACVEPL